MSFHFVPHLPRLDAMVAKFLRVKESERFYLLVFFLLFFSFNLYTFFFIFINSIGKQRKMPKKSNIHCYSYEVKSNFKFEWCACFDSE